MEFRYRSNWRDYVEAQSRYSWELPLLLRWVPGLLLGVGAVLVPVLGWSVLEQAGDRSTVLLGWILLVGSVLFLGLNLAWPFVLGRELFSEDRWMHIDHTVRIDENGLLFTCELSTTQYPWVAFLRVIETQNLFVLPLKLLSFHWIPKNAFNPEQLVEFRDLLKRKLPSK